MIASASQLRSWPMIMLYIVLCVVLFICGEALWITYNGTPVSTPTIDRGAKTLGNGAPLTLVVLGDSTAISQGGSYGKGYAMATAQYLAKDRQVTWVNLAVSGARSHNVADEQLSKALSYRPDVALVAVGANDVTHLTRYASARSSLQQTIKALRRVNPEIKIVLTGSPDMGSVPRFPQPVRWLAGERTKGLNRMVSQLAQDERVIFAPIAERTGPTFRRNPRLFAPDKFHPNTEGYRLWTPIITRSLE
jgi:lysophospholipase L1-like esterase